jgi:hypothetical protein
MKKDTLQCTSWNIQEIYSSIDQSEIWNSTIIWKIYLYHRRLRYNDKKQNLVCRRFLFYFIYGICIYLRLVVSKSNSITWCDYKATGVSSGTGAAPFYGTSEFYPDICGIHIAQSLVFCVVFCRSSLFFVLLSHLFWPLHCLSLFLIIPLVSSTIS